MAKGFKREVTVRLKKISVRMTSPDNIANWVRIQKGGYYCAKVLITVTSLKD
jgi:hypothetical protein